MYGRHQSTRSTTRQENTCDLGGLLCIPVNKPEVPPYPPSGYVVRSKNGRVWVGGMSTLKTDFGRLFSSHKYFVQFCGRFPMLLSTFMIGQGSPDLTLKDCECSMESRSCLYGAFSALSWSRVTMKMPVFLSTLWGDRTIGCMNPEIPRGPA